MSTKSNRSKLYRDKLSKSGLTCKQLAERLIRGGALTKEQVQDFWNRLDDDSRNVLSFADTLIEKDLCTTYQVTAAASTEKPLLKVGSYRIIDKIGEGGMGQVFRAVHQKMKREVALKVLSHRTASNSQAIQRFAREVEAAARLSHKNIVTAHDAGDEDGMPYLVMEYVVGTDLYTIVKRNGLLPFDKAMDYIKQAATGLAYAHRQGIVHRDVKPANLLLDESGIIKILDMGLARLEIDSEFNAADGLTATGVMMGTVDYMPPEQSFDPKLADARSDIYSLGCTLYFLLMGHTPYTADTLFQRIIAHRDQPIPDIKHHIPELPGWIQDVFARMVAKSPSDRFQTMDELVEAIEACLSASDYTSPVPEPTSRANQSRSDSPSKSAPSFEINVSTSSPSFPSVPSEKTPSAMPNFAMPVMSDSRSAAYLTSSLTKPTKAPQASLHTYRIVLGVAGAVGVAVAIVLAFWPKDRLQVASPRTTADATPAAKSTDSPNDIESTAAATESSASSSAEKQTTENTRPAYSKKASPRPQDSVARDLGDLEPKSPTPPEPIANSVPKQESDPTSSSDVDNSGTPSNAGEQPAITPDKQDASKEFPPISSKNSEELQMLRDDAIKNGDLRGAIRSVEQLAILNSEASFDAKLLFLHELDATRFANQKAVVGLLVELLEQALDEEKFTLAARYVDPTLARARQLGDRTLERRATRLVIKAK
jgi:serine/threonine protein kinase